MSARTITDAADWLPQVQISGGVGSMQGKHFERAWPEPLAQEAFYGPAGELISLIAPHSEADPVGLLTHFLVGFGNLVGRSPHFTVGGTTHHTNLFCVNVGATASRKGTAKDDTFFVIRTVDPAWYDSCVQSGLSSGEGLIWAVRDPVEEQQAIRDKGRVTDYQMVITDPGITDKRVLLVESEFGSTLRVLERDGNTLSAQIRQAWDSGDLRILTKTKAAKATGAHVSILGHVTQEELMRYLNATEQANGFANRYLWVAVKRSKFLPDGGQIHQLDLDDLRRRLRSAYLFAQSVRKVERSEAAGDIWRAVYRELTGDRQGLFGAVTSRAEAQTMRIALIYALLDCSSVIQPEHLNAGLAVWSYCESSARYIFGDAIGDATADGILRALRSSQAGLTRTELSGCFGRNKSAGEINRALTVLSARGLAAPVPEEGTQGRPAERWLATENGTKETK